MRRWNCITSVTYSDWKLSPPWSARRRLTSGRRCCCWRRRRETSDVQKQANKKHGRGSSWDRIYEEHYTDVKWYLHCYIQAEWYNYRRFVRNDFIDERYEKLRENSIVLLAVTKFTPQFRYRKRRVVADFERNPFSRFSYLMCTVLHVLRFLVCFSVLSFRREYFLPSVEESQHSPIASSSCHHKSSSTKLNSEVRKPFGSSSTRSSRLLLCAILTHRILVRDQTSSCIIGTYYSEWDDKSP